MGLASPVSQQGACPQVVNQQELLFIARSANGGYNWSGGGSGVYSNASMPNYVPAGEEGVTGGGLSTVWEVIDAGGSQNSAGAIQSSAGQVLGKIVWDAILNQWVFVLKEARYSHTQAPSVSGSSNSKKGKQIKDFLTQLNTGVDPAWPTTPQLTIDGLDNSISGTGTVA